MERLFPDFRPSRWWLRAFYLRNGVKSLVPKWTYPSAIRNKVKLDVARLRFCLKMSELLIKGTPVAMVDETTVNLWMRGGKVWTRTQPS